MIIKYVDVESGKEITANVDHFKLESLEPVEISDNIIIHAGNYLIGGCFKKRSEQKEKLSPENEMFQAALDCAAVIRESNKI